MNKYIIFILIFFLVFFKFFINQKQYFISITYPLYYDNIQISFMDFKTRKNLIFYKNNFLLDNYNLTKFNFIKNYNFFPLKLFDSNNFLKFNNNNYNFDLNSYNYIPFDTINILIYDVSKEIMYFKNSKNIIHFIFINYHQQFTITQNLDNASKIIIKYK